MLTTGYSDPSRHSMAPSRHSTPVMASVSMPVNITAVTGV